VLAAAGYLVGLALLVWGLLAGALLPILLGLVIVGIVLIARPTA
jgi:hypothetical protein